MKIALAVGHSRSARGAVDTDGVSEWDFHQHTVRSAAEALMAAGHEVVVFERRPHTPYKHAMASLVKAINDWGADLAIEFHFDAFTEEPGQKPVHGTTGLYWPGSSSGRVLARVLSSFVAKAQGTRDRGGVGQARSWSKGRPYLYFLKDTAMPACILETHFGDESSDVGLAALARDTGATGQAIADAIARYEKNR